MTIEIRPVDAETTENWDKLLMQYPNWSIYQTSSWLKFIEKSQGAKPLNLGIFDREEIKGLWPGLQIRKGPFRLFGSPMSGWTTAYMGPAGTGLSPLDLLEAWKSFLMKNGYHHGQVSNPVFTEEVAKQAGLTVYKGDTYSSEIPSTEAEILAMFKKSCREAIRKSVRHGVEVENTDDPAFIDHYYYQVEDVFGKQGIKPTYPKSRIEALWETFKPSNRLITAWAKHEGKVVATSISIIGNKALNAYGWASLRIAQKHSPNEPLQLLVLKTAAQRGCERHEICGGGNYKKKYGANLEGVYNILFYRNNIIPIARQSFSWIYRLQQKRNRVGIKMPARPALNVEHNFET